MADEFSIARTTKLFLSFRSELEDLQKALEDPHVMKQEIDRRVASLLHRLNDERERSARHEENDFESRHYEPAVAETIMHLEKYNEAESFDEAYSALYDASFSIGYYLSHVVK